jgi:hypothetical protein
MILLSFQVGRLGLGAEGIREKALVEGLGVAVGHAGHEIADGPGRGRVGPGGGGVVFDVEVPVGGKGEVVFLDNEVRAVLSLGQLRIPVDAAV